MKVYAHGDRPCEQAYRTEDRIWTGASFHAEGEPFEQAVLDAASLCYAELGGLNGCGAAVKCCYLFTIRRP